MAHDDYKFMLKCLHNEPDSDHCCKLCRVGIDKDNGMASRSVTALLYLCTLLAFAVTLSQQGNTISQLTSNTG